MSYARFSSDDFASDVYAYEDCAGGFTTHVASNRVVGDIPQTPDFPEPGSEPDPDWAQKMADAMNRQHDFLRTAERKPIGLPHDGERFNDPDLRSFLARIEGLAALGYKVPADVVPAIWGEIDEAEGLCPQCHGKPVPALACDPGGIPAAPPLGSVGCLDCDFHGTRAGYDATQAMIGEAF